MRDILHSVLWAFALVGFVVLTAGLSLAGLSLGGAAVDHPVVVGLFGDCLAVRALLPISGMGIGAAFGLWLGCAFGNTDFITKG
jgi:hydrogenase/urease accessory protein HupE